MIKLNKDKLSFEEEMIMDTISNAIIDLILSDPKKYLVKKIKPGKTITKLFILGEYMCYKGSVERAEIAT